MNQNETQPYIYLDYAAHTPPNSSVLEIYSSSAINYTANPNSRSVLGKIAFEKIQQDTNNIARLLNVKPQEIIFTSGASESNNLAIKGIEARKNLGKHIITTYLEHSSVLGACEQLKKTGYEIEYVDIDKNGKISLEHLKSLVRNDTVLISICTVDSELGTIQPIEDVKKIASTYKNCLVHTDATQAVGKVPFFVPDMLTLTPHKFYGLLGCGILTKATEINLTPLITGGISLSAYRSGTPDLAQIAALNYALENAISQQAIRYKYVLGLNRFLRENLKTLKNVVINSPDDASPYILNISVLKTKPEEVINLLNERGICISSKSACTAVQAPSRSVMALTHDKNRALSSVRISLSHLTTKQELEIFLTELNRIIKK